MLKICPCSLFTSFYLVLPRSRTNRKKVTFPRSFQHIFLPRSTSFYLVLELTEKRWFVRNHGFVSAGGTGGGWPPPCRGHKTVGGGGGGRSPVREVTHQIISLSGNRFGKHNLTQIFSFLYSSKTSPRRSPGTHLSQS